MIFIVVSLFFWFLTKLSKEYQNTLKVNVNYTNIPLDRIIKNKIPSQLDLNVTASGFKLLYAKLVSPTIDVECSNLKGRGNDTFLIDFEDQRTKIQNQLSNGIALNYFEPTSIEVGFDQMENKKVKVHPDVSINFKDSYDMYGKEMVTPDSILVSGPKSILDTLTFIRTEKLELVDVEKDISEAIKIGLEYKEKSIVFKETNVQYEIQVDKFTEGNLEIPFTIINEPEDNSITTFPNTIKLTYKVGLSDYNKVNKSLFLIECDYKESIDNGLNFLIPKIVKAPNFIKDLHINTQKIDFFLKK